MIKKIKGYKNIKNMIQKNDTNFKISGKKLKNIFKLNFIKILLNCLKVP